MAPNYHAAAIGTAVHSIIREAGLSLKEFGQRAGIPTTTLSRRINGHTSFTWAELALVVEICDVSFAELAERAEKIKGRAA